MGVVYEAEDTKLKRTVALKFLPPDLTRDPEAKARFVHEAQAASSLDHPNICNIHEIGESGDGQLFITMARYEGETLNDRIARGPLPIDETMDIASQITQGLAKAHEQQIVHRDIKPGNVFITSDGLVKILDFGLAKLSGQTRLTRTGTTMGTVAYMSPEQARGDMTDQQTDIWSIGAVMYEMLTGELPFRGGADQALVHSILTENPEPVTSKRPEVPVVLEDVIERALQKDLRKRYQSIDEMLAALQMVQEESRLGIERRRYAAIKRLRRRRRLLVGLAAVVVIAIAVVLGTTVFQRGEAVDSLAVLPLENLSGDPDQDYLVDGITGDLITGLSRVSGFKKVISRRSVMRYKGTDRPLKDIARELGVNVFMAGTVQRVGEQVKLGLELIDAGTEENLWSDNFEKSLGNIEAIINEITRTVADEIDIELTPREHARLASARPANPEAYDLYTHGRFHYYKLTKEGTEKGIEYFHRAIEADSSYAPAYAMLAVAYNWYWFIGYLPLEEALSKGTALINKALEIDDECAEARMALAEFNYVLLWDWEGGVTEYERSIELNPGAAEVHCEYSWLLMAIGRAEEAIAEAKRCLELDPVAWWSNWVLTNMYYHARQYDQAIAQCRQWTELEPSDSRPYRNLAMVYARMDRYEDAVRARQKEMTLSGSPPEKVAALDSAYAESGPEGYWRLYLESSKGRHDSYPTWTALFYAQLGDKDQAFTCLEKAYEKHDGPIYLLKVSPWWDPLRDDPRYDDLVRRMNFPGDGTNR